MRKNPLNVISDHFRFFVRSIVCPNGVSLKSFLQRKKDASKIGDGGDSPIKGETGMGLEATQACAWFQRPGPVFRL